MMDKFDIERAEAEIEELVKVNERVERFEEALQRIVQWSLAYPSNVFPEMELADWEAVRKALEGTGITLDRISASCMRHVVKGCGDIARRALEGTE